MPFDFDVFISYSNKDDAWARKLYKDLVREQIDADRIFMDKEYLKPGVVWQPTMSSAVLKSKHLIVLWSNNAQASNWVPDELAKFSMTIDPEGKGQPREDRKLIVIPLEGENNAYNQYQWINELKQSGAYANGIDKLDENIWTDVVNKAVRAIRSNSDFSPIMLSVLAMTRDRIDELNLKTKLPGGDTLAQAVNKMGIMMSVELLDHLDPAMQISPPDRQNKVLSDVLNDLSITTQADPDNPQELKIVLPNGDSLAKAVRDMRILNLPGLVSYLKENPGMEIAKGITLAQALANLWLTPDDLENLILKVALRQYYEESAFDWRPFGSPRDKIATIMAKVKSRFNKKLVSANLAGNRFRWEVVKDFWSGTDEAEENKDKLARRKSVIVLDPLSLYDAEIDSRFKMLFKSFDNDQALIMAFAPFELPTPSGVMRTLIKDKSSQIYEYFFEPEIHSVKEKTYAKCGPDVGEVRDIDRWLRTALKPQGSATQTKQDADKTATLIT